MPLAEQIQAFGSYEFWEQTCAECISSIPNGKFVQIKRLRELDQEASEARRRADDGLLDFRIHDSELNGLPSGPLMRQARGAELAFEKWLKENNIPFRDLNAENIYSAQDYVVCGKAIDVKTTINFGRPGQRVHWLPDPTAQWENEVICGVVSWQERRGHPESHHEIVGILDRSVYQNLPELVYFKPHKTCLNACFLQPPAAYFGVLGVRSNCEAFEPDVLEFCLDKRLFLSGIIRCAPAILEKSTERFVPPALGALTKPLGALLRHDCVQLLPHYLADFFLMKIIAKEKIDADLVWELTTQLYPSSDRQEDYLNMLARLSNVLPSVRCAHHPDEGIDEMDIEPDTGASRLIIYARCGRERGRKSTLHTYCWKTLETLTFGDAGVDQCDARGCGCLTHLDRYGTRVGRKGCRRYGARLTDTDY